jgi:hypothetical protein
MFCHLCF